MIIIIIIIIITIIINCFCVFFGHLIVSFWSFRWFRLFRLYHLFLFGCFVLVLVPAKLHLSCYECTAVWNIRIFTLVAP